MALMSLAALIGRSCTSGRFFIQDYTLLRVSFYDDSGIHGDKKGFWMKKHVPEPFCRVIFKAFHTF